MDTRRFLYLARIQSHLTLEQIGLRTALSPTVLRLLDEGRFERLPGGLYARSYVRAFAAAVGLDPQEALARVEHLLPRAPDPSPAEAVSTGRTRIATAARQVYSRTRESAARLKQVTIEIATGLAEMVRDEIGRSQWSLKTTVDLSLQLPSLAGSGTERFVGPRSALRSRAAAAAPRHEVVERGWSWLLPRFAAAIVDASILLALEACLVMIVAQASGVELERLLRDAGVPLACFCAIPLLFYFLFFEGIAGRTPGESVCAHWAGANGTRARTPCPLTLRLILLRALG